MTRRIKINRGVTASEDEIATRIDAAVRQRLDELGFDSIIAIIESQQHQLNTYNVILTDMRNSVAVAHSTFSSTKATLEELLTNLSVSLENLDLINENRQAESRVDPEVAGPSLGDAENNVRTLLRNLYENQGPHTAGNLPPDERGEAEEYEEPDEYEEIDNLSSEPDVVERMMDRATQQGTMPERRRRRADVMRRRRPRRD